MFAAHHTAEIFDSRTGAEYGQDLATALIQARRELDKDQKRQMSQIVLREIAAAVEDLRDAGSRNGRSRRSSGRAVRLAATNCCAPSPRAPPPCTAAATEPRESQPARAGLRLGQQPSSKGRRLIEVIDFPRSALALA